MIAVEAGQIDGQTARIIVNIAAQINNSFYAEAKVAIAQWQLQREAHTFGNTPLDSDTQDQKLIERKENDE